jgi:hypothetical protein
LGIRLIQEASKSNSGSVDFYVYALHIEQEARFEFDALLPDCPVTDFSNHLLDDGRCDRFADPCLGRSID